MVGPTDDSNGRVGGISRMPEFGLLVFSFLINFVWEFLQVPTFAGMAQIAHWDGIKLCTAATFGDVGIALAAYWLTSMTARSRYWFAQEAGRYVLLFLLIGVGLTVTFEYYYTSVSLRWTYSDLMPRIPPFGTGLGPLVQWIIVPLLVLWFMQRFSVVADKGEAP